jgi:hypothetical protein
MEQQSIVLYLARKGLSPFAIHDDLVTTLAADAMSYLFVTRYLRDAVFSSSNPPTHLPEPETRLDDWTIAITPSSSDQLSSLSHQSESDRHSLTHLPRTTVHPRLTNSLGFHVRHHRLVPNLLSHSQNWMA